MTAVEQLRVCAADDSLPCLADDTGVCPCLDEAADWHPVGRPVRDVPTGDLL